MIIISLGSNLKGPWGDPGDCIARAFDELNVMGLDVVKRTPLIETSPIGRNAGSSYTNALCVIGSFCPPHALLQRLKSIEHKAGRREARFASVCGKLPRWRPRVLDLDILDWHGVIIGPQDDKLRQGYVPLTLPHISLYNRDYVQELLPLLEDV